MRPTPARFTPRREAGAAEAGPLPEPGAAPAASIRDRAAFDFIRYGSVWEDADVLCAALAPVARDARLLSIASAGDNALALLTLDPREVVAVDLSAAQIACLWLRIAAFRRLGDEQLLPFLGVAQTASGARLEMRPRNVPLHPVDRFKIYRGLRPELPPDAARFWDAHPELIAAGVIHAGKFERYLRAFRRYLLPLVHSNGLIEQLCRPRRREEQRAFYERRWDSWRWRTMFRLFFSRTVMGRLGRDPSFFDHVEGPVASRILERTRYALTELPVSTNPYLTYIMTGNYRPEALPRYLRPEQTVLIRSRLDRIRVVQGAIQEVDSGRFDGMNLSDIFEYMSAGEHERCYAAVIGRARPGARIVYWNMLAPRSYPHSLEPRVRALTDLAESLHRQDLAWFYQRLHVDEVLREETG